MLKKLYQSWIQWRILMPDVDDVVVLEAFPSETWRKIENNSSSIWTKNVIKSLLSTAITKYMFHKFPFF